MRVTFYKFVDQYQYVESIMVKLFIPTTLTMKDGKPPLLCS